jgi:hypothetical protein
MFLKSVISFLGKRVNEIPFIPIIKVRPSTKIFTKSQTHMSVTFRSLVVNSIQIEQSLWKVKTDIICAAITAPIFTTLAVTKYICNFAHKYCTEIYPDLTKCSRYAQHVICAIKWSISFNAPIFLQTYIYLKVLRGNLLLQNSPKNGRQVWNAREEIPLCPLLERDCRWVIFRRLALLDNFLWRTTAPNFMKIWQAVKLPTRFLQ